MTGAPRRLAPTAAALLAVTAVIVAAQIAASHDNDLPPGATYYKYTWEPGGKEHKWRHTNYYSRQGTKSVYNPQTRQTRDRTRTVPMPTLSCPIPKSGAKWYPSSEEPEGFCGRHTFEYFDGGWKHTWLTKPHTDTITATRCAISGRYNNWTKPTWYNETDWVKNKPDNGNRCGDWVQSGDPHTHPTTTPTTTPVATPPTTRPTDDPVTDTSSPDSSKDTTTTTVARTQATTTTVALPPVDSRWSGRCYTRLRVGVEVGSVDSYGSASSDYWLPSIVLDQASNQRFRTGHYSITRSPPGVRVHREDLGDGERVLVLVGTPTRAGTYKTTLTGNIRLTSPSERIKLRIPCVFVVDPPRRERKLGRELSGGSDRRLEG